MNVIRILIADDHPVFRFGLRALIKAEGGLEVVGEATTGLEAVSLALDLAPDVVLMDINMPALNGIEATRRIMEKCPATGVLIITMFEDDSLLSALQAGARGYIIKGSEGEDVLRAIRAVAKGEAIFSPAMAEQLAQLVSTTAPPQHPFPTLTDREREILTLMALGLTNSAIAERLSLRPKTVRNQVSNIFSKLQVAGRAEAIILAREAGLGTRPSG
jgi:DNA-binding NarL/FixJ family response regulator